MRRRLLIASVSVVLAALLLRASVAAALVTRGDELLHRGALDRALVMYSRALWFDGASVTAADRYAFTGFQLHSPSALRSAVGIATHALRRDPSNRGLLLDRGLALHALGADRPASEDFERVARLNRDPVLYHFAAWSAYRGGSPKDGVRLWRDALTVRPGYAPARRALRWFAER